MILKITVLCYLCVCAVAFSLGRGDLEKYGPFSLFLHSPFMKCDHNRNLELDVSAINIHIYDFSKNFTECYPIADASKQILNLKNFDKKRKIHLFVGGFKSQINKKTLAKIREAYKTHPDDYLILIDHSPYTGNEVGNIKGYKNAVLHVHYIGKSLGEFLIELNNGGVNAKNIHCVGHSLGAQILAHTGETFTNGTGEKIARISGLDPAGPCFSKNFVQEQIRSGVADFVDIYHCNSGGLGTSTILGDVDFIINRKGQSQPNCGTPIIPGFYDSSKAATCSHRTCVDIWTATVKNKDLFPAYRCDSYKQFSKGSCSTEKTIAGASNPGNVKGIFYFSTTEYDLKSINDSS